MRKLLLTIWCVMFLTLPAMAVPVDVYYQDGPQDPLFVPDVMHELGDWFPADELIETSFGPIELTACPDPGDDPDIMNIVVTMTNWTNIKWCNVHYVADPETTISNFDGWIGNAGMGDATQAFRIDSTGINKPLLWESQTADACLEPFEVWEFIIQDYLSAGAPPTPFDSVGIAGMSAGWPPSTGSIIAIPEPATMVLLISGGLFALLRRRRT